MPFKWLFFLTVLSRPYLVPFVAFFAKTVNHFQLLTFFAKKLHINV